MDNQKLNTFQSFFFGIGEKFKFVGRIFLESFFLHVEWRELIRQCFQVGVRTLPIITFTAFIAGFVFTKQSLPTLEEFGAEAWLPKVASIGIVRALGPLIAAIICSGKLGSAIGAELSSMAVSEQIDAMEISGTNPFRFLAVTRVAAVTIMLPLLVIYSDAISLFGSFLLVTITSQTSLDIYFGEVFDTLRFSDVIISIGKPIFFGLGIGLVSTYCGYYAERNTSGVGRASNTAVVASIVTVFILDLLFVQIQNLIIPK